MMALAVVVLPVATFATAGGAAAPPGLTYVGSVLPRHSGAAAPLTVWEDLTQRGGTINFFAADNTTLVKRLTKRDVDAGLSNATASGSNSTCCGQGFKLADLVNLGPDLLGMALLKGGGDPDEAAVRGALPGFVGAKGQVAAFVGSRRGPAYPLTRDGAPVQGVGFGHAFLNIAFNNSGPCELPAMKGRMCPVTGCDQPSTAGIVGGYLPVLRWTFDEISQPCGALGCDVACSLADSDVVWELTVLGEPEPPSPAHQTVWFRYLRYQRSTGTLLDSITVENNQAYPSTEYDSATARSGFYAQLLKTSNSYDALFGLDGPHDRSHATAHGTSSKLITDLGVAPPPEAATIATDTQPMVVMASDEAATRLIDQAKHSLIREWIVRPDTLWGRYGVPPDGYGLSESDGFQENVNSGATAALAWGFLGTARGILSSYWRYMVRDDGGIKYRGAMLPGYGRMLTVLAQYITTTDDDSMLSTGSEEGQDISHHVDAVVRMIEKRIVRAQQLPSGHIAHGLPLGCDEADSCEEYGTFIGSDGDLPYFSAAMEVWRGLRDLGRVYRQQTSLKRKTDGQKLLAIATKLSSDIATSWTKSKALAGCPPYVAGAGANKSVGLSNCTRVEGLVDQYHPTARNDQRVGMYLRVSEPWRAFAEMAHSGYLTDVDVAAIYHYQQQHDSLMRLGVGGGVNIDNAMFGHTAYGLASGLVSAGMAEEFLLFLFAQSHHGCTQGTWTFWEKVLIDRSKSICCFAAPAQLTVPSALRWGLAFEDEGKGVLALARAVPRVWFAQPGSNLTVINAPVSRQLLTNGVVSFSLHRRDMARVIMASIQISGPTGPALQQLSLRLRMPSDWGKIKSVTSGTGEDWTRRLQPVTSSAVAKDVLMLGGAGLPSTAELTNIVVAY